jgi:hypothetical protein
MYIPGLHLGFVCLNVGLLARNTVACTRRSCGLRNPMLYMIFFSSQKTLSSYPIPTFHYSSINKKISPQYSLPNVQKKFAIMQPSYTNIKFSLNTATV